MQGDSLHPQETAVEPGPEKMLQIGVERLEIRAITGCLEQVPPESHQRLRAMSGGVDAAQQLLARRFHDSGKSREIRGIRRALIGRRRANDRALVWPEISTKHFKETTPFRRIHGGISLDDFPGQNALRRLSPLKEQGMGPKISHRA